MRPRVRENRLFLIFSLILAVFLPFFFPNLMFEVWFPMFFRMGNSNLTLLETCVDARRVGTRLGAQERALAPRNIQARKISQNYMLHIKSYVFGVENFEFDTFENVRGRTRGVGTRLVA